MSAVLKEEAQRFAKAFVSYTKVIVGGMLFASLFFFIYSGVKANYISLEILAAVLATFTIGVSVIFAYFSIRAFGAENRFKSVELALKIMQLEELKKANRIDISENQIEAVKRQIEKEVMNLSQSQLKVFKKQDSSYQFFAYSTSHLIAFIIAGALRDFVSPRAGGFFPKPQEDEVQKHIAH